MGQTEPNNRFKDLILSNKRTLIAITLILVSVVLYFLNIENEQLATYKKYFKPIAEILVNTLLSISVMILIYERLIHKDFSDKIRDEVIGSMLLREDIICNYNLNSVKESIKKLISLLYGNELGYVFNAKIIDNNKISKDKCKKNFIYNIVIENGINDDFYKATLCIEFEIENIDIRKLEIETTYVKNGFDLKKYYQTFLRKKESIYRYIILTDNEINLSKSLFKTKRFDLVVHDKEDRITIDYIEEYIKRNDKNLAITFQPKNNTELRKAKKAKGKKIKISMLIETIVDKKIRAFPIRFGYPVYNFNSSITANNNTNIVEFDVIEFINSSEEFNKIQTPSDNLVRTSAGVNGWVIPESGFVYVWQS